MTRRPVRGTAPAWQSRWRRSDVFSCVAPPVQAKHWSESLMSAQASALVQLERDLPALAVAGGGQIELGLRLRGGAELAAQAPHQRGADLALGRELALDDVELGADADARVPAGQPDAPGGARRRHLQHDALLQPRGG